MQWQRHQLMRAKCKRDGRLCDVMGAGMGFAGLEVRDERSDEWQWLGATCGLRVRGGKGRVKGGGRKGRELRGKEGRRAGCAIRGRCGGGMAWCDLHCNRYAEFRRHQGAGRGDEQPRGRLGDGETERVVMARQSGWS